MNLLLSEDHRSPDGDRSTDESNRSDRDRVTFVNVYVILSLNSLKVSGFRQINHLMDLKILAAKVS
jgi:hypothetical protein